MEIVRCFRSFLEFCYLARRDIYNEKTLSTLRDALGRFHHYRRIFQDAGLRTGFSLPRQHSMVHYETLIRAFSAPNGLCSSITESKHIKAVKEPYRWSNCYKALGQMLKTNQRLDKLAALRVDFTKRGMLEGTCLSHVLSGLGMLCIFSSLRLNINAILIGYDSHASGHDDGVSNEDQEGPHHGIPETQGTVNDGSNNQLPNDDGAVDGPAVSSFVEMAHTVGQFDLMLYCLLIQIKHSSNSFCSGINRRITATEVSYANPTLSL